MRLLRTLAFTSALALGACQAPDGSTDWGSTLALGAGVGLAAGLLAAAASDNDDGHRRGYDRGGYRRGGYDRGGYSQGGYGQGGYSQGGYGRGGRQSYSEGYGRGGYGR
ncbi:hypothetical protein C8P66_13114 [Humitalea rosea]|uniref:Uncharacterized protein n=1 Tax=Humitalea rosea TaxID=990373 RepID=A0A2W7HW61_9PROT|nr:hypothetical protein [Humitalea rosea]PZW38981.1 hypothetical protein C8P66_13114 [Humitalea rosea]